MFIFVDLLLYWKSRCSLRAGNIRLQGKSNGHPATVLQCKGNEPVASVSASIREPLALVLARKCAKEPGFDKGQVFSGVSLISIALVTVEVN